MSYRKIGTCEECGKEFGWSMGHPPEWNEWALESKDMAPSQRWWFSFGNLCPVCAPSFDEWMQGQAELEGETMILWIVGKVWTVGKDQAVQWWGYQGIFDDEQVAVAACEDGDWFIGPVEMNVKVPVPRTDWPGAYYPLAGKKL